MYRVEPHPAYTLHRRKFRETSAILEVLSAQHGRLSCVMKGVYSAKRKSQKSPPELFQAMELAWSGRGEMPTITHFELSANRFELRGKPLFCAMYVNELIVRLVNRGEANPALFRLYESVLSDLLASEIPLEQTLRKFEKYLLEICGYGLLLEFEADSGSPIDPAISYGYRIEHGPVSGGELENLIPVSGLALRKFANDELLGADELPQIKRLMRAVLAYYLGDKPLASRSLFV